MMYNRTQGYFRYPIIIEIVGETVKRSIFIAQK